MEAKKRKRIIILAAVGCALIAGVIYGIRLIDYNKTHEETDNAQIEGDIVPIIPRTAGYITSIRFGDNQFVKANDTLFRIDDRELTAKLRQAEAAVENAAANVQSAASLIRTAEANLAAIKANAEAAQQNILNAKARLSRSEKDFDRYKILIQKRSITQQQFDATSSDKVANEAQLAASEKQYLAALGQEAAARAQIANYHRQVSVAQSVVQQRQEDLAYARLQLTYAAVIAPYDGYIYKKLIQLGQYVQPGSQLFNLIVSNKMWVVANFKETQINRMKTGQRAEITIDALGNRNVTGTVLSFSKSTGSRLTLLPPDNSTGNFVKVVQRIPVKISLDETDSTVLNRLSVGMNVVVNVTTN